MAKHLESLQIKNFRMLEDFTVEKLGDVNLIVGKNNSGKSTVLEALRIYAGNAERELLVKIAKQHGEKYKLSEEEIGNKNAQVYFKDFFSSRSLDKFNRFLIGGLRNPLEFFYIYNAQNPHFSGLNDSTIALLEATETEWKSRKISRSFFVQKNSFHHIYMVDSPQDDILTTGLVEDTPCTFITTQLASLEELALAWDEIVFTEAANFVCESVRLLEPKFTGISFVKDRNKQNGERTAIVSLEGQNQPMSLRSLGDGMQRILQIAMNIYPAKDGFLLIDEFENGLHYSVQEKVWQMIFEMAKKLNIQVFATTHSRDCIEAFTQVANDRTDVEGVLFRMGRSAKASDNGKIIATVFDEAKLDRMTRSDMEIR